MLYLLVLAATIYVYTWFTRPIYRIPSVDSITGMPLLSYFGALKYFFRAHEMLMEGCQKHDLFRVPLLERWIVVASSASMIQEIQRLPDSQMSFLEAGEQVVQMSFFADPEVNRNPVHVDLVRGPLTHSLNSAFQDIVDEASAALQELIPLRDGPSRDEWVKVSTLETWMTIVTRTANRIFVGLPLCRNMEYISAIVGYSYSIGVGAHILNSTPSLIRPFVAKMLYQARRAEKCVSDHVYPLAQAMLSDSDPHGFEKAGDDRDNFLAWLVQKCKLPTSGTDGLAFKTLVQRLLVTNLASTHTTSYSTIYALYELGANPQAMAELRQEADAAIQEHGWTRTGLESMWKFDSFLRESQRVNPVIGLTLYRVAMQDVKLSTGIVIPKGSLVAVPILGVHLDEKRYENADEFSPFRFYKKRMEEGDNNHGQQFVSTSADFVSFGLGKHACPGRFFASSIMKAILVYLIHNYDIKLESGEERPKKSWILHYVFPPKKTVMIRNRQDALAPDM